LRALAISMGILVLALAAIFGWNPFVSHVDPSDTLQPGYSSFESGTRRLPNGTYQVSALTRMPGVSAEMVRWWFAEFLQTSEHYSWWHPTDHVWMDWENKKRGEIVGASHLVHEYIGGELLKLRIQFVDPAEFFGFDPNDDDTFVICALPGLLEEPIYISKMCHVVRNTPWGAEMRSRFWMGHIAARNGDDARQTLLTLVANTALVRWFAVDGESAKGLLQHAIEEMGYLSDLLPGIYVGGAD
jgi:hypothetical protein